MSFSEIPGQERAKAILQNGLRTDNIAHAYLFSGPEGTGRKKMALALAKALLCVEKGDDSCGQCVECRKVEHGNHPNLYWIEPDGAAIKIEQIRELQKQFSYRAVSSQIRIYIISQADRMTIQAANSLLKFLEEPLSPTVAILVADNGQALLPTIQSRAQGVPFSSLPPSQLADTLIKEGVSPEIALSAAHLTAGLENARKITQANWFAETRNVMIQLMKDALSHTPSALLGIQRQVMKADVADHMDTLFDLIILWLKDMIHATYRYEEKIVHIDQKAWLSQQALSRNPQHWVICLEQAVEAKKRLRAHANPQLVLEHFILQVKGG